MESCAKRGTVQVFDSLAFEFKENPRWRRKGMESTAEMLQEISEMKAQFECLVDNEQKVCTRGMEVAYVHHSNLGEGVGTQTYEDTQALTDTDPQSTSSRDQRETINTFNALRAMEKLDADMESSGLLTVDQICNTHAIVLDGLHPEAGKLREITVFTRTDKGIHYYPRPEVAEQELYDVVDRHNIHMEALEKKTKLSKLEKVTYVVKCAAWLLFHFVDTHPFVDGNGRTCRLLGNYVLSLVAPFPVSVYSDASTNCRRDYIDAIVCCRENPTEGPSELAAMMVEGLWLGWKKWKAFFESSEKPTCIVH